MESRNIWSICRNVSLYHAHICMGGAICSVPAQTACESIFILCPLCDLCSSDRVDLVWNRQDMCICRRQCHCCIFEKTFHLCGSATSCDAFVFLPYKRIWDCKEKGTCYLEEEVERWKKKMKIKMKKKNLYCAAFWMQLCMQSCMRIIRQI